jgi:NAD(P)-dependent dehydrogenase (short-subunit alcohol dehydrogenase family)
MNARLTNRVALVTGGARGIGAATAVRLAAEGAAVAIADVLDDEARAVADRIRATGGRAEALHLDVSNEAEWTAAIERTVRAFGGLHVLVNNAGVARLEDVETETREGYDRLIAINQTGTWLGMKAAAAALKRSGHSSVINVSSIYGAVGGNGNAFAYHASKGAMRLMTKNAAIRWAREGIRVNSVHPGFIETPMVAPFLEGGTEAARAMQAFVTTHTPMGRIGTSEEVAGVIAFLASDDASYVTGSEVYVDGGWTAW